jgi:2-amino-4-hydroxy-6-hydroxymethyldihydropteridine diphosphokinase
MTVVSLGSNLGDREAHLRAGLAVLAGRFPVRAVSPVYESSPVGVTDQPAFLNCVAVLDTGDAEAVLVAAHDAEETRGRVRSRRWGPRTLDVDVVAVDRQVSSDPRLTLPHPRAHERAFVLVPWLDIDPEAELVGHGLVRDLVRRTDLGAVRRVDRTGVRRWGG